MLIPEWFDYRSAGISIGDGYFTFPNVKVTNLENSPFSNSQTVKRSKMAPVDRGVNRLLVYGGSTLSPQYMNFTRNLSREIKSLEDSIPKANDRDMDGIQADLESDKFSCIQGLVPERRPMPIVNGTFNHVIDVGPAEDSFLTALSDTVVSIFKGFNPSDPDFPLTVPLSTVIGFPYYLSDQDGSSDKSDYLSYLYGGPLVEVARLMKDADSRTLLNAYGHANVTTLIKRKDQGDSLFKVRLTKDFWDAGSILMGRVTKDYKIDPFTPYASDLRATKQRNVYQPSFLVQLITQILTSDAENYLKTKYRATFGLKARSSLTNLINLPGAEVYTYDVSNWDHLICLAYILATLDGMQRAGISTEVCKQLLHAFTPSLLAFGTRKGLADSWCCWSMNRYVLDAALLSGTYFHTSLSNLIHVSMVLIPEARKREITIPSPAYDKLVTDVLQGRDGRMKLSVNSDDLMVVTLNGAKGYSPDPKVAKEDVQVPSTYLGFQVRKNDRGRRWLANRPSSYLLNFLLKESNTDAWIGRDVFDLRTTLYKSTGTPYIDSLLDIFLDVLKFNYGVGLDDALGPQRGTFDDFSDLKKMYMIKPSLKYYMSMEEEFELGDIDGPKSVIPQSVVHSVRQIFEAN
jgi:hypothetical protein